GDEKRFSQPDEFVQFVQEKLSELTTQAVEDKTPEEQQGILTKSLDFWKKVAATTPKLVLESIKDPKKQVAQIQDQIQDQIQQVSEVINQKIEDTLGKNLELDDWRSTSKNDFKQLVGILEKMSNELAALHQKVDNLTKKKK
ncbi:MAG: hypothetical protein ACK4GN_18540, partial [Runella sp.]